MSSNSSNGSNAFIEEEGLSRGMLSAIMRYRMKYPLDREGFVRKDEALVMVGRDDGSSWPDYIEKG